MSNEHVDSIRDQLFAEAVVRFRRGDHWWPDPIFEAEHIKPEQEARRDADAWEPLIADWLDNTAEVRIRVADVAQRALGIEASGSGAPNRTASPLSCSAKAGSAASEPAAANGGFGRPSDQVTE